MEKLKGPFNDIIPNFQKYKKSLGYKYDNISSFYMIDKILIKNDCNSYSDTKRIYQILITNEPDEAKRKVNYYCLKELFHFLEIERNEKFYLPPYYSKKINNHKSTILTLEQINVFFKQLDKYCDNTDQGKSIVFPVIFRLVFSCGLRISEALNLKTKHFSKVNKTIFIEKSKENVDRLLPLSNSMYKTLMIYDKIIDFNNNQEYLFEINNKPISYSKVRKIFNDILKQLDFNFTIHDLRHNFCVTNFNQLFGLGYSEDWILYYLHFYLGHKNLCSTEHYLQLTSNRYTYMIKKIDKANTSLFPKVGDYK